MIKSNRLIKILEDNKIDYATSGKNVGSSVICAIDCPFCGDDTGKHLGIFPSGVFSCWKSSEHVGRVEYLLSRLLKISINEAKILVYGYTPDYVDLEDHKKEEIKKVDNLTLPNTFVKIDKSPMRLMFYNYLKNRKFDNIEELCDKYNILCCYSEGEWNRRIIFPIYINNKLVTWVGRTISTSEKLRYKNLSSEMSVMKSTDCLYNYDNLVSGGKMLVITEGIFDALKVDFYTDDDIKATCVFTNKISDNQIKLLLTISNLFNKIYIAFDADAFTKAIDAKNKLSFMDMPIDILHIDNKKDFGDFSKHEIIKFFKEVL